MTASLRKLTLTVHVTASVGWLGALAVFFAHSLASLIGQDEQIVRAASLAMGLTAWFVILPLSLTSLATGLVQALGTAWGLFQHYWILFKLLLATIATAILLLKLGPISYLADVASEATFSSANLVGLRTSLLLHAGGGLLILLTAATLAIYKPNGLTPYGIRKQRAQSSTAMETPRWAKVFGVMVVLLILLVVLMLFLGGHGPGAHMSDG